jgi:hypothetical protein
VLYPVFRKIPPALHIVFNVVFQDAAGNKIGSFSYLSPEGNVLRTDYVADALGYRVASNALPVGPSGPAAAGTAILARRRRETAAPPSFDQTPAATGSLAASFITPFAAPIATTFDTPLAFGQTPATTIPLDAPFPEPIVTPFAVSLGGPLSGNIIAQLVLIGPNAAALVIKKVP